MSNMKFDAIVRSGIEVGERVRITVDLIPDVARVEMDAMRAAGYVVPDGGVAGAEEMAKAKGRNLDEAP
jgi:hypothetical protein